MIVGPFVLELYHEVHDVTDRQTDRHTDRDRDRQGRPIPIATLLAKFDAQ